MGLRGSRGAAGRFAKRFRHRPLVLDCGQRQNRALPATRLTKFGSMHINDKSPAAALPAGAVGACTQLHARSRAVAAVVCWRLAVLPPAWRRPPATGRGRSSRIRFVAATPQLVRSAALPASRRTHTALTILPPHAVLLLPLPDGGAQAQVGREPAVAQRQVGHRAGAVGG